MNIQNILSLVKTNLGIVASATAYDVVLEQIINAACRAIAIEGITLDSADPGDVQLVVMYSVWLWNKRKDGGAMPRMLRWQLNNRVFAEKAATAT